MDGQNFVQMTFDDYFSEMQKSKMKMPSVEVEKSTASLESQKKENKVAPSLSEESSVSANEPEKDEGRTIQDFGEKIGGAKKDLWKIRGLLKDDLIEMNDSEQDKYIKKDYIWKKVDYEELVRNGLPIRVAYYIKKVRDALPTKPIILKGDNVQRKREGYIEFISAFRDALMALKTESDMMRFYNDFVVKEGFVDTGYGYAVRPTEKCFDCFGSKLYKNIKMDAYSLTKMDRDIKKNEFCYTKEQSMMKDFNIVCYSEKDHYWEIDYNNRTVIQHKVSGGTHFYYPKGDFANKDNWTNDTYYVMHNRKIISNNHPSYEDALQFAKAVGEKMYEATKQKEEDSKKGGKKRFPVKGLEFVRPSKGNDYRHGKDVTGEDYLETFHFRGGEYGKWLNDTERQGNLNFGYDAFMDLADALQIKPQDISLGGRLSIAFGARGSGSAMAHYEPMREVINLTKMKGAGSLAHEWGHALDNILCSTLGENGFLTDGKGKTSLASMKDLLQAMRYKEASKEDVERAQKNSIERSNKTFMSHVTYHLPDRRLSEEQLARRDAIVAEMIKEAPSTGYTRDLKKGDNKGVDALNDLYKEVTGSVIPKKDRENIANAQYYLGTTITHKPEGMRVETQFYADSKKFDTYFSKQDKGYWQSSVEMFARAFSCYVYDTLGGSGKNDYLCGHSNLFKMDTVDKEGKDITLYAYPVGEERKVINAHFEALISECKELGLLHQRDVEIRKEKPSSAKEKEVSDAKDMDLKQEKNQKNR